MDASAREISVDGCVASRTSTKARRAYHRAKRASALAFAAAIAVAVSGVAFGVYARGAPPPAKPCSGAVEKFGSSWNDARRETVAAAFRATGAPFAEDVWRATATTLDVYGRDWAREYTETCQATRVRGEQSEAVLDLRMQCLDRRLIELRALTDLLARADARVVERAAQATHDLEPLSMCSVASVDRSDDARSTDADVDEALARTEALRKTGQSEAAERAGQSALEAARATKRLGPETDARNELAEVALAQQNGPLAETRFFDALEGAERMGRDGVVARAEIGLGLSTGVFQSRPDDAERWFRLAASTLDRSAEGDERPRVRLLIGRAWMLMRADKTREAVDEARRAIGLVEDRLGGDWRLLVQARNALGSALYALGNLEEAVQVLSLAVAAAEDGLGDSHPDLASLLTTMANANGNLGRHEEARAALERARHILERTDAAGVDGRLPRTLTALGALLTEMGLFDDAHTTLHRALDLAEGVPSVEERQVAEILGYLGNADRRVGKYDDALRELQRSTAMFEHALGPHHPHAGPALCVLGLLYLDRGEPRRARAPLEESLSIAEGPLDCEAGSFALAKALWQTGGDRMRAAVLVKQARDYFREHPTNAAEVREFDEWFQKHAPELGPAKSPLPSQ